MTERTAYLIKLERAWCYLAHWRRRLPHNGFGWYGWRCGKCGFMWFVGWGKP